MNKIWSNETPNERRIRLFLLTVIVVIVLVSFYAQYVRFQERSQLINPIQFKPMVSVIQKMNGSQNPIIAMVKNYENKPILILYEINVSDRYKFETLQSVELKEFPKQIASDALGIWLEMNDDWYFFDQNLQARPKRPDEIIVLEEPIKFYTEKNKEKVNVTVILKGEKIWEDRFNENPILIDSISVNNDKWLIVFEDDVVIYESNQR